MRDSTGSFTATLWLIAGSGAVLFALCVSMTPRADRARRDRAGRPVRARYAEGARALAPIGVAAFAFALSFGVLARAAGMGWLAPLVMSATTFAGSAQFAVASILARRRLRPPPRSLAARVPERALRPDRDLGRVVLRRLGAEAPRPVAARRRRVVGRRRSIARPDSTCRVLLGAGALLYSGWNAGTAVGVLLGNAIGDANRLGLDAAFPALFLALLSPSCRAAASSSRRCSAAGSRSC